MARHPQGEAFLALQLALQPRGRCRLPGTLSDENSGVSGRGTVWLPKPATLPGLCSAQEHSLLWVQGLHPFLCSVPESRWINLPHLQSPGPPALTLTGDS